MNWYEFLKSLSLMVLVYNPSALEAEVGDLLACFNYIRKHSEKKKKFKDD